MDVAEEVKDRAALSFLDWYLKEQVEEEASVGKVLATLKLIGDDKNALLSLDKDLATRVFTPPVIG
jgi:ferritin